MHERRRARVHAHDRRSEDAADAAHRVDVHLPREGHALVAAARARGALQCAHAAEDAVSVGEGQPRVLEQHEAAEGEVPRARDERVQQGLRSRAGGGAQREPAHRVQRLEEAAAGAREDAVLVRDRGRARDVLRERPQDAGAAAARDDEARVRGRGRGCSTHCRGGHYHGGGCELSAQAVRGGTHRREVGVAHRACRRGCATRGGATRGGSRATRSGRTSSRWSGGDVVRDARGEAAGEAVVGRVS